MKSPAKGSKPKVGVLYEALEALSSGAAPGPAGDHCPSKVFGFLSNKYRAEPHLASEADCRKWLASIHFSTVKPPSFGNSEFVTKVTDWVVKRKAEEEEEDVEAEEAEAKAEAEVASLHRPQ